MKVETINGIICLTAEEGKVLRAADGIYGKTLWLGVGRTVEEFDEIDEEVQNYGT